MPPTTLTVDVKILDLPEVMQALHAARDVLDSARQPEDAETDHVLVPRHELTALSVALAPILPGPEAT